jgi:hypothetical protein
MPEMEEDPKEILKRVMMLEMQISMLRQQLEDDELPAVETEEVDKDQLASILSMAANAQTANALASSADAALPSAEVSVDGHVDGYA